jgi:hypothetical protein
VLVVASAVVLASVVLASVLASAPSHPQYS